VRIAVPTSITYIPIYLARELGYYNEEGLEVVIEDVPGGSKALQAMFGGSVDLSGSAFEMAVQLTSEGHSVRSFLTILERPGLALAVSPASKRRVIQIGDLKGAVVGISVPGSASHYFLRYLLARNGISETNVGIASIGLGATAAAALERGQIDAGVLTGSAITTMKRRFPNLLILADGRTAEGVKQIYGVNVYPAHDLLAPTEWLRRNPVTARKLVRAVLRAMQYMQEHSVEQIRSHMPTQSRSPDADADLEALRATVPMLSRDGSITSEGAQAVREVLTVISEKVRTANFDLASTFTNEFVSKH
jgi:NitT/TauT family transport system substrate-binding protein